MWGCGKLGIWYVRDLGCLGCRMWGCGIFAGMQDVDLQNARFF